MSNLHAKLARLREKAALAAAEKEEVTKVEDESPKAQVTESPIERMRRQLAEKKEQAKEQEKKETEKVEPELSPLEKLRAKMATPTTSITTITSPSKDGGETVSLSVGSPTSLLAKLEKEEPTSQLDKDQVTYDDLNDEQKLAVTLGTSGNSFVLIGSAGSGKTTTQRMILQELSRGTSMGKLTDEVGSKHLHANMPSVLITSFTKVATRNIKAAAPTEFKGNCINIHKAVEFAPTSVMREVINPETNAIENVERQMFVPQKNRYDPLKGITHVIIEEAGSLDTDLFLKLVDALPNDVTYIFLGDLNQIPPVYGAAILGFAIDKLPVVELKTVYRQNIGAIKELATEVLIGKPIPEKRLQEIAETSKAGAKLTLVPMTTKKKVKAEEGIRLNKGIGDYIRREVMNGNFQEGNSVILTTIRKDSHSYLNINELNRYAAQAFSELHKRTTYEVRSKSQSGGRFYFAIGDLVFFEREYYKIEEIKENPSYIASFGYDFKTPSETLTRWGIDKFEQDHLMADLLEEDELVDGAVADFLNTSIEDIEEEKNMVSHQIKLVPFKDDEDAELETAYSITLKSPGDFAKIQLGYAQTAHSAQGSEWKNVYLGFPDNVGFMLNREILYTSITRAREELTIFYEDGRRPHNFMKGTFEVGVKRQAIEGDDLLSKIKFFRQLGSDVVYRNIPRMLSRLNRTGKLDIEGFYSLNEDGSHNSL